MKLLSCNVNGRTQRALGRQLSAVIARKPDILALQEVTLGTYDAWCRSRALAGDNAGLSSRSPSVQQRLRFPADPPTVEEIVAVMRCAGDRPYGLRTRALIVLLWRAGLRISEALSLAETDLDPIRGSIVIRRGKGRTAPRGRVRRLGLAARKRLA